MRKWVFGFNQEMMVKDELDLKDIMILRFISDFIDSGKAFKKDFYDKEYHWVRTKFILENVPVLDIKTPNHLRRRIRALVKKGYLDSEIYLKCGTYTFFRKGEKLIEILDDKKKKEKIKKDLDCIYEEIKIEGDWY